MLTIRQGTMYWKEHPLGPVWAAKPAQSVQIAEEEELAALATSQDASDPIPLHLLHQCFFWARGEWVPEDYIPFSSTLGILGTGNPGSVFFLGRRITPKALENGDVLRLAQYGLNAEQHRGLAAWRMFPWLGLQPRNAFKELEGGIYKCDTTLLSSEGEIIYELSTNQSSPAFRDWLTRQPLRVIQDLGNRAITGLKIHPEVHPGWEQVAVWERNQGREAWGLYRHETALYLAGPGVLVEHKTSKRNLQRMLEAGYLSPNDPTRLLWLEAVTGKRLKEGRHGNVKPTRIQLVRENLLLAHYDWWRLCRPKQQGWVIDRFNREPLTSEELDLIGQHNLNALADLTVGSYTLEAYLGLVQGKPLAILKRKHGDPEPSMALAVLNRKPGHEQVLLRGTLEEIVAANHESLVAMQMLVSI